MRTVTNRKRANQRDIARLAGVSQTVVSHVINQSNAISIRPETRERVLKAVKELSYVPHSPARSLRLQRTSTVSALIPDITNPFYPEFVRAIQDELLTHGLDLNVVNTDGLHRREAKGLDMARRGRVDAIIGVFFHLTLEDIMPLLNDGVPVVVMSEAFPQVQGDLPIDFVTNDGVASSQAMTNYLLEKGHRHIGMIAGEDSTPPREQRVKGFRMAMADAGVTVEDTLVISGDFTEVGGYHAMLAMLDLDPRPTAVFASNDLMAMGALLACRERGVTVPNDIALVGYDNIPAAKLTYPSLTTLDQQSRQAGKYCVEHIVSRLNGTYTGPSRKTFVPFSVVPRESG